MAMIVEITGDPCLLQAASEIQLGYPGLSVDDAAAELILKQALQLEASGAAVEGD